MKARPEEADVIEPKIPPRDPEPALDPTNPGFPRPPEDPDPDVIPLTDPIDPLPQI